MVQLVAKCRFIVSGVLKKPLIACVYRVIYDEIAVFLGGDSIGHCEEKMYEDACLILIRHQFLLSLRGHRASTKRRHLALFPGIILTSLQLFPFSNVSLWTVLPHVCIGLFLLLLSCGFQSKSSFSMASCPFLIVCPIGFHFCLILIGY